MKEKLCASEVGSILSGWSDAIGKQWIDLDQYLLEEHGIDLKMPGSTAEEALLELVTNYVG